MGGRTKCTQSKLLSVSFHHFQRPSLRSSMGVKTRCFCYEWELNDSPDYKNLHTYAYKMAEINKQGLGAILICSLYALGFYMTPDLPEQSL